MDTTRVYILFSCNEWKEFSSMEIIAVSTNINDIYEVIKTEIQDGNMAYETSTKRSGVIRFNNALRSSSVNLDLLDCGYVDYHTNLAAKKIRRKKANRRRLKNA